MVVKTHLTKAYVVLQLNIFVLLHFFIGLRFEAFHALIYSDALEKMGKIKVQGCDNSFTLNYSNKQNVSEWLTAGTKSVEHIRSVTASY